MSEMEPREAEIDGLLRRSMSAPVPRLSSDFQTDFERGLRRELRRRSRLPNQYGRILLVGYGVVSAATSILVMRSQGLGWEFIAGMTIGPIAIIEVAHRLRDRQKRTAAK